MRSGANESHIFPRQVVGVAMWKLMQLFTLFFPKFLRFKLHDFLKR